MNYNKELENIFDSLRKILFYAGHGKYNHVMPLEDVQNIKNNLEKILELEKEYKIAKTIEEQEAIYKRLEPFKTFSIRDFLDCKIDKI